MSRRTKAFPSAYGSQRPLQSIINQGETRLFSCDWKGALDGATVSSQVWASSDNLTSLASSTLTGSVATVKVTAPNSGETSLTNTATLSDGRVLVMQFNVTVQAT